MSDQQQPNNRPVLRVLLGIVVLASSLATGGCSIGTHATRVPAGADLGPPQTIHLCILQGEGVPADDMNKLIGAMRRRFEPYGLSIEVSRVQDWPRPGFFYQSILAELVTHELEPPCDRIVGLVQDKAGDVAWQSFLPTVIDGYDGATRTRGYQKMIARFGMSEDRVRQVNRQIGTSLMAQLLGCPAHLDDIAECQEVIAKTKAMVDPQTGFIPGITKDGKYLMTREEVNKVLRQAIVKGEY